MRKVFFGLHYKKKFYNGILPIIPLSNLVKIGLTANSFVPYFGQADAAGNIYFLSVNGLLGFNPNRLNIQSSKNKVRLWFVSPKRRYFKFITPQSICKGTNNT